MCVCQDGDETFNRAKLLNIGYAEALKEYDYNCFVFSDVDLIPMDDRNTYKCFSQPRHLSVSMDKFGFRWDATGNKGMRNLNDSYATEKRMEVQDKQIYCDHLQWTWDLVDLKWLLQSRGPGLQ